jgi:hypothetical protein
MSRGRGCKRRRVSQVSRGAGGSGGEGAAGMIRASFEYEDGRWGHVILGKGGGS